MALGVDTTSHATAVANAGVTTLTWNHTCGASATKLVVLATGAKSVLGDRDITGVTYNTVALSFVGAQDDANFCNAEIWKLDSPATGSALSIVVTYGGPPAEQARVAIRSRGCPAVR